MDGAVLTGTIIDTATKQALEHVIVTVSAPALPQEVAVATDAKGQYRIPQLPKGSYTVRAELAKYQPEVRGGIFLRQNGTTRLNLELRPAARGR